MNGSAVEELVLRIVGDTDDAEEAVKRVRSAWGQLGGVLRNIQTQNKGMAQSVDQVRTVAQTALSDVGNAASSLSQIINNLAANFSQLLTSVMSLNAAFLAGAGIIRTIGGVAARVEVLENSLLQMGETANYSRQELTQGVDQLKKLGISTSEANNALLQMVALEMEVADAIKLANVARNLAVQLGKNTSQTYSALVYYVSTGNSLLLRKFGIMANSQKVEEAAVHSMENLGIATGEMTDRQRALNFLLEEGKKRAGVYANAMNFVGKQIGSMPRYIEEAQLALGRHFLPVMGLVVGAFNNFLKYFTKLPAPIHAFIANVITVSAALSGLVGVMGILKVMGPALVGIIKGIAPALSGVALQAAPVLLALTALAVAIRILRKGWEDNWGSIRTTVARVREELEPYIEGLRRLFDLGWTVIGARFQHLVELINDLVVRRLMPVFYRFANWLKSIDWDSAFGFLFDAIRVLVDVVVAVLDTITSLLQGRGARSFDPLHDAFVNVLTMMVMAWDGFISDAVDWGYNLAVQIANGIVEGIGAVINAVLGLVNSIGAYLMPGSPPKKGPLSRILEWGKGLINTYVQSFKLADFSLLRDALSPIKQAFQSALSVGDIDEAGFVEQFGAVREQVAQLIAQFRETGQIDESILSGIGEALGEGSEELTKYLRLQLEHQRALENLKKAQEEYSQAEAGGFVPAEVASRLQAAQAEAAQAEEAYNWQREYLALQQDSIDMQARLVKALQKLAEALDRQAKAAKEALQQQKKPERTPGEEAPSAPVIESPFATLEFSAEFKRTREEVERFLALPFAEKVDIIIAKLSELTGLDLTGFVQRMRQSGLVTVLREELAGAWESAVEHVETHWSDWMGSLQTVAEQVWNGFVGFLTEKREGWSGSIADKITGAWTGAVSRLVGLRDGLVSSLVEFVTGVIAGVKALFEDPLNIVRAGFNVGHWIGSAFGMAMSWLTTDLPLFADKVTSWFEDLADRAATWLEQNGPTLGTQIWNGLWTIVDFVGDLLFKYIPAAVAGLVLFAGGVILGFVAGVVQNAPEWLEGLAWVGQQIVKALQDGIAEAWNGFLDWVRGLFADLAAILPGSEPKDSKSPLADLAERGKAFVANIVAGLDFVPLLKRMIEGLDFVIGGMLEEAARMVEVGAEIVVRIFEGVDSVWEMELVARIVALVRVLGFVIMKFVGVFDGLVQLGKEMVRAVQRGVVALWNHAVEGMAALFVSLISTLAADVSVIEDAYAGAEELGWAITEAVGAGIDAAWPVVIIERLVSKFANLNKDLQDRKAFDPLQDIAWSITQAIKDGLDAAWPDLAGYLAALVRELEALARVTSTSVSSYVPPTPSPDDIRTTLTAAGVTVIQTFEGGLNFPGVTDGRDALGVREALDRDALAASMVARLRGAW